MEVYAGNEHSARAHQEPQNRRMMLNSRDSVTEWVEQSLEMTEDAQSRVLLMMSLACAVRCTRLRRLVEWEQHQSNSKICFRV